MTLLTTPLFTITATQTAEIISYTTSLFSSFLPILAIIFGVSIGIYIINGLIHRGEK
jgi:hypothetical protein